MGINHKYFGYKAYYKSSVNSIDIPNYINTFVLNNGINHIVLTYSSLTLPNQLKVISEESFARTSAELVVIPQTVEIIEADAFSDSSVRVVVFEGTSCIIAEDAFSGCMNVRFVCDPDSIIANWAYNNSIPVISTN